MYQNKKRDVKYVFVEQDPIEDSNFSNEQELAEVSAPQRSKSLGLKNSIQQNEQTKNRCMTQKIEKVNQLPPALQPLVSMESKDDNLLIKLPQYFLQAISNEICSSQDPSSYLSSSMSSSCAKLMLHFDRSSKNPSIQISNPLAEDSSIATPIFLSNLNSMSRSELSERIVVAINQRGIAKMLSDLKEQGLSMPNQKKSCLIETQKEAISQKLCIQGQNLQQLASLQSMKSEQPLNQPQKISPDKLKSTKSREDRKSKQRRVVEKTRRMIEKSKILPERFRFKNFQGFDLIAEDMAEDSPETLSSHSSTFENVLSDGDNPLEETPLDQIPLQQKLVNESFAVEAISDKRSGSHSSVLTPLFDVS